MLDSYIWGDADRISYEAPIPVLRASEKENRLGGAGSVLSILAALEVDAVPVCVVGDDRDGDSVIHLIERLGVTTDTVVAVADRPTTVKERFLGRTQSRHPQQMIRVDHECTETIDDATERALLERFRQGIPGTDLVLISDYSKGVCTDEFVRRVICEAREAGIGVIVDPGRDANYRLYAGATCITPNRSEAVRALGREVHTPQEGLEAARQLAGMGFDAAAVTLDRDGIAWASSGGECRVFPVRPRQVYDITGAGDAVLASMGFAIAMGADWPAAIQLANLAGGLEVERLGVAPITRSELLAEMNGGRLPEYLKVLTQDALTVELQRRRGLGHQIVMTNGCFDLLHPGHVKSLQFARNLGDCLVVGLNSDASVARLKGDGRPIVNEQGRALMLAALACVDYVVLFDETSVAPLVERIRPAILVKAAQYTEAEVVGGEFVRSYGGRIVLAPLMEGVSTSEILRRTRDLPD